MHVCSKVFQIHLLHRHFVPEQIHGMDADSQPANICQGIMVLIFEVYPVQFDGVEQAKTDAFQGSFGIDSWFDLFECNVGSSLLHGRDAEDDEKYDIQQYDTSHNNGEYTSDFCDQINESKQVNDHNYFNNAILQKKEEWLGFKAHFNQKIRLFGLFPQDRTVAIAQKPVVVMHRIVVDSFPVIAHEGCDE